MYIIKLNEQQTNCAVSVKFHSSLDFNEVKSVLWDMFQTPTPFPPLGTHPNKPRLFKLSDLNELQILQQLSNIFYFIRLIFSTWEPACLAIVHPSWGSLPPGSHSAAHEVGKTLIFYTEEVTAPYTMW